MEPNPGTAFVETAALRILRSTVEGDVATPIVLVGEPGSGKTTILEAMKTEWQDRRRPVALVSLLVSRTPEDILARVAAQFAIDAEIVQSTSLTSLYGRLHQIRGVRNGLVLCDDVDEQMAVDRGLRRVVAQLTTAGCRVVIAARSLDAAHSVVDPSASTVIHVDPIAAADLRQFLAARFEPAVVDSIAAIAQGNPRLTRIALLAQHMLVGVKPDDIGFSSRTLLAAILEREAEGAGIDPAAWVDLMARLALRGPLALPVALVDPAHVDVLRRGVLVRSDGDRFTLNDPDLRDDLLRVAKVMPSIDPGELRFGAEEAERDPLLAAHFVAPPGLDDVRSGHRNIVVGDRGAGKSALFESLTRPTKSGVASPEILRLEDPADLVLRLESGGKTLTTAEQFRAAWLLSLACTLACSVRTNSTRQQKQARTLRESLPDLATAAERSSWGERLRSWWREARGVGIKFQFGPVTLESPKASGSSPGRAIDVSDFLRTTAEALREEGRKVLVAIDRIDEVHKYERAIQEPLVQGLFLAEASRDHGAEIGLIIFIRTDLFETYDIQEKNKLVTRQLSLGWRDDALLRMAAERVFSNVGLAGLARCVWQCGDLDGALAAVFPPAIEGRPFEEWLWLSLRNGNGRVSPRQLILLLVLARDAASKSMRRLDAVPLFSEITVRSAMTTLSELSFNEATADFRVAPTFLRNLRAGKIEEFAPSDVDGLFSTAEGEIASQLERLERLGIVERLVVRDADGRTVARLRLPPLYTRCWHGEGAG